MLLLLIILITLLVFLLFLCSSSLIIYYLNMAWLCRVTVFWLFWTSQLRSAHQQRQTVWWTRHLSSSFLPGGMCSLPSQKQACVSLGEPLLHPLLILLKRERCTDERERQRQREKEVLYLQQRWLFCLYNMVLKSFRLFRNQSPKLVTYLLTYNGTFLILKSN